MRGLIRFGFGFIIGAWCMFLFIEQPWIAPEERTGVPTEASWRAWTEYFLGEEETRYNQEPPHHYLREELFS